MDMVFAFSVDRDGPWLHEDRDLFALEPGRATRTSICLSVSAIAICGRETTPR
jgi:hypothetical protein